MPLTADDALRDAQWVHPLDLVARIDYIRTKADYAVDEEERRAWGEALALTRNGVLPSGRNT